MPPPQLDHSQIRQILDWYTSIEWGRLERKELGDSGNMVEVGDVFQRIRNCFDFFFYGLQQKKFSEQLQSDLAIELIKFKELYEGVLSFTDVTQRASYVKKIRKFEYELMFGLGKVLPYFQLQISNDPQKTSPLLPDLSQIEEAVEKKVLTQIQNLEEVQSIALHLKENNEILKKSIDLAKNWLVSNEDIETRVIARNANNALKKAQMHETFYFGFVTSPFTIFTHIGFVKNFFETIVRYFPFMRFILFKLPYPKGIFWWLLLSVFFGTTAMGVIGYFIYLNETVTVGNALLRISAVIIPSYFALLFAHQYLNHRKLNEFYMFKDVSLQTMIDLRARLGSSDGDKILDKALGVMFTEPTLESGMKLDQTLLKEILELLRKNSS